MKYQKIGFDSDKNAYIISERDDSDRLIGTYTAYPNFTIGGEFIIVPACIVHSIEEVFTERQGKE